MNSLIKFGGLSENYIWELQVIKRKTQIEIVSKLFFLFKIVKNCIKEGSRAVAVVLARDIRIVFRIFVA